MLLRSSKSLFTKTKKEMNKLNKEYEEMTRNNKISSSKISQSIQRKSNEFNSRKLDRSKHFNSIRNK